MESHPPVEGCPGHAGMGIDPRADEEAGRSVQAGSLPAVYRGGNGTGLRRE